MAQASQTPSEILNTHAPIGKINPNFPPGHTGVMFSRLDEHVVPPYDKRVGHACCNQCEDGHPLVVPVSTTHIEYGHDVHCSNPNCAHYLSKGNPLKLATQHGPWGRKPVPFVHPFSG